MKFLKDHHIHEEAVQAVEELMREHEVSVSMGPGTLVIYVGKAQYYLTDIEDGQGVRDFPRSVESEKLVLPEGY